MRDAMRIGYARVSKGDEQDPRLETRALKRAGVSKVFEEKASGGRWQRPELVLSGRRSAADVARLFRVHPSTITRLLATGAGQKS